MNGWRDCHDDALDVMVKSGLDVASARTMATGEVVRPQTKVVQKCKPSAQFGVQRDAMCAKIIADVIKVDVAAISEIYHVTKKYSSATDVAQESFTIRQSQTRLEASE